MHDQIEKYTRKLLADRAALDGRIAFAVHDDTLLIAGAPGLAQLAGTVLSRLTCLALVAAAPPLPFADFLIARGGGADRIVPSDTETRTFLHDIPVLRADEIGADPSQRMAELLANRKGIIAEGIGIVATGTITVEQAFIN
jgi:hypothetical protein